MITIRHWEEDSWSKPKSFHLTADGHAGADHNADGHDLVCCAVSTLMQALAHSCSKVDGLKVVSSQSDGFMHISLWGDTVWDEILPRYTMVLDALEVLSYQHPEHIRFS